MHWALGQSPNNKSGEAGAEIIAKKMVGDVVSIMDLRDNIALEGYY